MRARQIRERTNQHAEIRQFTNTAKVLFGGTRQDGWSSKDDEENQLVRCKAL